MPQEPTLSHSLGPDKNQGAHPKRKSMSRRRKKCREKPGTKRGSSSASTRPTATHSWVVNPRATKFQQPAVPANKHQTCVGQRLRLSACDSSSLERGVESRTGACVCVRVCVFVCVRVCVRACVGAWVRGCVGAWVRGCVGGCVGGWVCGWVCVCGCVCVGVCVWVWVWVCVRVCLKPASCHAGKNQ